MAMLPLVLALAACNASMPSVDGPQLSQPDSRLLQKCKNPVALPSGTMTPEQIELYWGRDRVALLTCGWNKKAVQDFYLNRDAGLRGAI